MPTAKVIRATPPPALRRTPQRPGPGSGKAADSATPPQALSRTRQRPGPGSGLGSGSGSEKAADSATTPQALSRTRQRPGPGSGSGSGSEKAADSARTRLVVPAQRRGRASSCLRGAAAASPSGRAVQRGASAKRTRSSSCTRRASERRSRTESGTRNTRGPQTAATASQKSTRLESRWAAPSHKAFTVFAPNPRKRRDIQRKAEAELAALEELRLSRAMAYVSINPSSVGGCMSLEEVRLKQQLDMMQARRKPKAMKDQVMEGTSVLPG